jgi:hypothetical protein
MAAGPQVLTNVLLASVDSAERKVEITGDIVYLAELDIERIVA